MKKTYVVIGLGRFGTAIASRLYALGNEVLAIDTDAAKVQHAEPFVTYAVIGDARDEAVLKSLGVKNQNDVCAVFGLCGFLGERCGVRNGDGQRFGLGNDFIFHD